MKVNTLHKKFHNSQRKGDETKTETLNVQSFHGLHMHGIITVNGVDFIHMRRTQHVYLLNFDGSKS